MSKHLPPHPNLKQLKIQAKDLRKAIQAADAESIQRLKAHLPRFSGWRWMEPSRLRCAAF